MHYTTLKRLVYALGVVGLTGAVIGRALRYGFGPTLFMTMTGPIASIAIVSPMVVCFGLLLIGGFPGGRRIVPLPGTRSQDTALFVTILTALTPSSEIGDLVPPGWPGASLEYGLASLSMILVCVIVRIIQLNAGSRLGVTLADGTSPTV